MLSDIWGNDIKYRGPGGVGWADTGLDFVVGSWMDWNIDFHYNGAGQADDTFDLTVNGVTAASLPAYDGDVSGIRAFMTQAQNGGLFLDAVPEPGTLVLLGLGGAFLRRRR